MKKLLSFALLLLIPTASFASGESFIDVREGNWVYPYLSDLVQKGVVDDAPYYNAERPLTRAEMVKIVVTATTGIAEDLIPASPSFKDVAADAWYYQYVETAHSMNIGRGYKDGRFRPEQEVNRAEAVAFLVRAFGIPYTPTVASAQFKDVPQKVWYESDLAAAYDAGLIEGFRTPMGRYFRGGNKISRGEMAKLVSVAMKKLRK